MRFLFEIDNSWTNKIFHCEANDIVSAMMIATDFIGKINDKLPGVKPEGEGEVSPFEIKSIVVDDAWPANEESVNDYIETLGVIYEAD